MQPPKYFDIFIAVFVFVLLMSVIMAQKLFQVGPFTFVTGILLFPISFIIGDVLTEVYGYARARRAIWVGFAAYLGLVIFVEVAIALPPASGWNNQNAFATTLKQVPRIVVASLIAYLAGEFVNSYVLAKLKLLTDGRHLWTRTIGSTVVGQAVDTAIFNLVAFIGLLPTALVFELIISGYLFKVLYETLATPLTYIIVRWLKRVEGIDHFDRQTDFTPFKL